VLGLAYYVPAVAALFASEAPGAAAAPGGVRARWPVTVALAAVTIAAVVVGFGPQWVLDVVRR
jgi:NADH-quinone oxidoreductase subunit N